MLIHFYKNVIFIEFSFQLLLFSYIIQFTNVGEDEYNKLLLIY